MHEHAESSNQSITRTGLPIPNYTINQLPKYLYMSAIEHMAGDGFAQALMDLMVFQSLYNYITFIKLHKWS